VLYRWVCLSTLKTWWPPAASLHWPQRSVVSRWSVIQTNNATTTTTTTMSPRAIAVICTPFNTISYWPPADHWPLCSLTTDHWPLWGQCGLSVAVICTPLNTINLWSLWSGWNFAVVACKPAGQTNGSPVDDASRLCWGRRVGAAGDVVTNDCWVVCKSLRPRVAQIARISDICHSRDPIWAPRHTVLRCLLHYVSPRPDPPAVPHETGTRLFVVVL